MQNLNLKVVLLGSIITLTSCSHQKEDQSLPQVAEEPEINTPEIKRDTVFLKQVKNAWKGSQLLQSNSPNEITEVILEFLFTNDSVADYLVVSQLDRYAKGFIVDGETGMKLNGDTVKAFEAENMVWNRPANNGLKFSQLSEDGSENFSLKAYHTWKLENSTVTDYYIYRYDEGTKSIRLTLKKNIKDEEADKFKPSN